MDTYKNEEEEKNIKKIAQMNKIRMRILHPNCFSVEDGKLSMRPFIEGLLKEFLKNGDLSNN